MAAAAVLAAAPVRAQRAPEWPDALLTRTQALALVQGLNAEILASRSATATLERWCRDHALASEPRVVAEVLAGEPRAPDAEQRRRLRADSGEVVRYRRVRLRCGDHVLSEAENWYLPGRLTPDMNRALETSDTPFGRVVAPLEPYRQTFAARLLWSPLPEGWERSPNPVPPCLSSGPLAIPGALFEHRALLLGRDNRPIAEVHEVYQGGLLAFSPPGPCHLGLPGAHGAGSDPAVADSLLRTCTGRKCSFPQRTRGKTRGRREPMQFSASSPFRSAFSA